MMTVMHHENVQKLQYSKQFRPTDKTFILFEYLKSENNEREYGSGKTELDISIIFRYSDPEWTYTCF